MICSKRRHFIIHGSTPKMSLRTRERGIHGDAIIKEKRVRKCRLERRIACGYIELSIDVC